MLFLIYLLMNKASKESIEVETTARRTLIAKLNLLFHLAYVQSEALSKLDKPDNGHLISPLIWFLSPNWANQSDT